MSELTGLGPLELGVLESMGGLGATPDHRHVKCDRIVRAIEEETGFGRSYAYMVMCDLAQPWQARVRLVDFHGNAGGGHYPPAAPVYTEARLTSTGLLALRSERAEIGPVPIGLINGTVYQDGERPPFDPGRVVDALSRLLTDPDLGDEEVNSLVGPPSFPQPCEVDGDIAALFQGTKVILTLRPRYEVAERDGRPVILIHDLPPAVWADDVVNILQVHTSDEAWAEWHIGYTPPGRDRLPISRVRDLTTGLIDHTGDVVEISLDLETDPLAVIAALRSPERHRSHDDEPLLGLRQEVSVDLGSSVAGLLRAWVGRARGDASGVQELRRILGV
ncbi:MAG TPA: hypothetical protein VFV02_17735 [Acidimicrobiales bacterium]|nr:hypothetical protein [Acidimicrobiales bacterium]